MQMLRTVTINLISYVIRSVDNKSDVIYYLKTDKWNIKSVSMFPKK